MIPLSKNLAPIHDFELSLGNHELRREELMWTKTPLAIIFEQPLHFAEIAQNLLLPPSVERWENHDTHYDLEAGYVCNETGHTLSGPLPG